MYIVTVLFSILPAHIEDFRKAVKIQAKTSLTEEAGCLQFDVAVDPDDSGVCFLYEIYEDREAFDLHLKSAHFAAFDKTTLPWVNLKTIQTYEKL